MLLKIKHSIQAKILLTFTLFILIILSLIFSILISSEHNQKLNEEKRQIYSLSDALNSVKRSSSIYSSNAARDYDSYFRDLDVYYKVVKQDLNSIDKKVNNLSQTKNILTQLSNSIFNFTKNLNIAETNSNIKNIQSAWKIFQEELIVEFGEKKDEPRLEWGAKYIVGHADELKSQLDFLIQNFDTVSLQHKKISEISAIIAVIALVIFTVGFTLLFYFQIIKPIKITKTAFQRVSDGDFGYQISSQKSDEIGQLVHSFNQMSARSNTVLSILSQLQSVKSLDQAINILFSQLTTYMDCDLAILVKGNLSGSGYIINNIAPSTHFKNLNKVNISIENKAQEEYIQKIFNLNEPIQIDSIESSLKNHNNIILKNLISRYPLKSALIQFVNNARKDTMIIFASYHENHLTDKHQELLSHLMPFINHKINAIMEAKSENDHS